MGPPKSVNDPMKRMPSRLRYACLSSIACSTHAESVEATSALHKVIPIHKCTISPYRTQEYSCASRISFSCDAGRWSTGTAVSSLARSEPLQPPGGGRDSAARTFQDRLCLGCLLGFQQVWPLQGNDVWQSLSDDSVIMLLAVMKL